MIDTQFITKLLDINQPMNDTELRFSTIMLLLRGARKLFGCDLDSGEYLMKEITEENILDGTYHSFQFSSIVNYLIFLEQIGSIFKPKNQDNLPPGYNGIARALIYFSDFSQSDGRIQALRALRNSLTHKFGLATEANPQMRPPHKFIFNMEQNKKVIVLPLQPWNGDFSDRSEDSSTTIFLINLVELVEDIYQKVLNELRDNNLEPKHGLEIGELMARYTIVY